MVHVAVTGMAGVLAPHSDIEAASLLMALVTAGYRPLAYIGRNEYRAHVDQSTGQLMLRERRGEARTFRNVVDAARAR